MTRSELLLGVLLLIGCGILRPDSGLRAHEHDEPGRPIGQVSVVGNLILMELNDGALGRLNLFDLGRRSLRFSPGPAGYRVENLPLMWDAEFGRPITDPQVTLHRFAFPFSGKSWESFSVGVTGSIRFGEAATARGFALEPNFRAGDAGGVSIGRFDPLSDAPAESETTVAVRARLDP